MVDSGGAWGVWNAIANVTTARGKFDSGTTAAPGVGSWHELRLSIAGNVAEGFLDGVAVFSGLDVSRGIPANGFPGLGTGDWGQHVLFDNFRLAAA